MRCNLALTHVVSILTVLHTIFRLISQKRTIVELFHLQDIESPLLTAVPLGFPIYLITLRDVTGKWQWFMQEANVLNQKYELQSSHLQNTNNIIRPTSKCQSL